MYNIIDNLKITPRYIGHKQVVKGEEKILYSVNFDIDNDTMKSYIREEVTKVVSEFEPQSGNFALRGILVNNGYSKSRAIDRLSETILDLYGKTVFAYVAFLNSNKLITELDNTIVTLPSTFSDIFKYISLHKGTKLHDNGYTFVKNTMPIKLDGREVGFSDEVEEDLYRRINDLSFYFKSFGLFDNYVEFDFLSPKNDSTNFFNIISNVKDNVQTLKLPEYVNEEDVLIIRLLCPNHRITDRVLTSYYTYDIEIAKRMFIKPLQIEFGNDGDYVPDVMLNYDETELEAEESEGENIDQDSDVS